MMQVTLGGPARWLQLTCFKCTVWPAGDDYLPTFLCESSVAFPAPQGQPQCAYSYRTRFPAPRQQALLLRSAAEMGSSSAA